MTIPVNSATETMQAGSPRLVLPVFIGTIGFSAFLLFGIQPMFTKLILPRLGGSPAVWSIAMVFFQAVLLAGYAYAHLLVSRFSVRNAALVHFSLMMVTMAVALPIGVASGFERAPETGESIWLFCLFAASVGLPFFAVSANGPLLQAWFSRTGHAQANDPYFLYAASNIGSFAALMAYPFLIEPFLPLSMQASAWTWGFAVLFAAIVACSGFAVGFARIRDDDLPRAISDPVPARSILRWVSLAFVPSALLLAVTAHISTDVAAAPFLWVVPLGLFLLTFVVAFQRNPVLKPTWMRHAQLVLVFTLVAMTAWHQSIGWPVVLVLHLALFFVTAMVAHGELAAARPAPSQLTSYFMWISAGGVLGGLFSGLLAPVLFNSVAEYYLLIILGLFCRPGVIPRGLSGHKAALATLLATAGFAGLVTYEQARTDSVRSFFGVHKIMEKQDGRFRLLGHGTTVHGVQRLLDDDGNAITTKPEPLSYYYYGSPISESIEAARARKGGKPASVAAIGLGSGSLACHVKAGENWRFFEIDRVVVTIARDRSRFRFISDCAPDVPIVIGDGRLTLAEVSDARFDLIIIDAFSSDSIPLHLLTVEAFELYKDKLSEGGSIVLHISNRNLELESVTVATAAKAGLVAMAKIAPPDPELERNYKVQSHVVVAARKWDDMAGLTQKDGWRPVSANSKRRAWTDDYADVIGAIIRAGGR